MTAIVVSQPFDLAATCAPVAWGQGRWPNVDWIDGRLVWVGWENSAVVVRQLAMANDGTIDVDGTTDEAVDAEWAERTLNLSGPCLPMADPVLAALSARFAGLRCFAYGSLFDGLVTSIVGQSISVAAAAVTERRLAALFHPGIVLDGRRFWPLPEDRQLADASVALVRSAGVTWRRAEALVAAALATADGLLPTRADAVAEPQRARERLRALPLVGPWTAESALLWGIALDDAYPTGDVALLRAARAAFNAPALDPRELDRLAEGWRPARGWAARLLWTALLGVAPSSSSRR